MNSYNLVVLSNPVEGREDAYNDWYDNRHLDDVLTVPGVVAAQRFRTTQAQRVPGAPQWRYMCIYEIEAEDVESVIAEMNARVGTERMPMSDAMSPDAFSYYFEPHGPRKSRP